MKRLLVVDDEPHVARVLRVSLAKEGWQIDLAHDGHEALAACTAAPPGRRRPAPPQPGGSAAGRGSRQISEDAGPAKKERVMTSMTARDQRSWAQELGGIEFLEKPVSPRRIATLLGQLVARGRTDD